MQTTPTDIINLIANEHRIVNIDVTLNNAAHIGSVIPITKSDLENRELIASLTEWRNRMRSSFLTQTAVTIESTTNFLANTVLKDPTRLLFLVQSPTAPVGTLGIKIAQPWVHGAGPSNAEHHEGRLAELANLLRGTRDGHPMLMYYAEMALLDWVFRELAVDLIWTAVPADNRLALMLHKSAGFRLTDRIPLHKAAGDGTSRLVPGEVGHLSPDGLYAQRIQLERSEFFLRRNALVENSLDGNQNKVSRIAYATEAVAAG